MDNNTTGIELTAPVRGLTREHRELLRAPFASSAIRWLPIAGVIYDKQQFMPHINASLVFERLSDVDPSWTLDRIEAEARSDDDPLGMKHGAPHRAWLTVCGVTRSGRGAVSAGGTEPAKSVESDAIKRAALAFEVGAYLRAFDTVFLPRMVNGQETFKTKKGKDRNGRDVDKFSYLTAFGKAQLQAHYDRVIGMDVFRDRYGTAVEYGDAAAAGDGSLSDDAAASASEAQAAEPQASGAELDVLVLLSRFNGRNTSEDVVRETLLQHPFSKLLPRILNSVAAHLLLDPDAVQELRDVAIAVVEGADDRFVELERMLQEWSSKQEEKES